MQKKIQKTRWAVVKTIISLLFKKSTYTSLWYEEIKPLAQEQWHDLKIVWLLLYNRKNFRSFYETADQVRLDLGKHYAMTQKKWGVAMLFILTLMTLFSAGTYGVWRLYLLMDRSLSMFWAVVVTASIGMVVIGWFLFIFRALKKGLEEYTRTEVLQGRFSRNWRPIPGGMMQTVVDVKNNDNDEGKEEDTSPNPPHETIDPSLKFRSSNFGRGADHKALWYGN